MDRAESLLSDSASNVARALTRPERGLIQVRSMMS